MSNNEKKKILFTGAGFSHNFGVPLTRDLWSRIFNQPEIKKSPILNNEFHSTQNYESAYANILKTKNRSAIDTANKCILKGPCCINLHQKSEPHIYLS